MLPTGEIPIDVVHEFGFLPSYCCFSKDYFNTAKLNPQSGSVTSSVGVSSSRQPVVISGKDYSIDNTPSVSPSSTDSNVPIQWIRAANALQKYLERNNLAGSRLRERFLARFGVTPSDIALDMSEYLGGSSRYVRIGDVTANADYDGDSPSNAFNIGSTSSIMGQTAGKATCDMTSGHISFHAKEFGTLLVVGTLVPDVSYVQGISKMLTRGTDNDKFAYYTPEMESLGYEPVSVSEVKADSSGIFGFVPRYQNYRVRTDVVSGDLVLEGTKLGMDSLYLSRDFAEGSNPSLNVGFVEIGPRVRNMLDRIFTFPGSPCQFDHFQGVFHIEQHIVRDGSSADLPSLEPDDYSSSRVSISNGGVRM